MNMSVVDGVATSASSSMVDGRAGGRWCPWRPRESDSASVVDVDGTAGDRSLILAFTPSSSSTMHMNSYYDDSIKEREIRQRQRRDDSSDMGVSD
jgi:hypothetical protein